MARKVNTEFQGASVYEVDVDQITYRRVIEDAAGDVALIGDIVTGNNSPPFTVNHSGYDTDAEVYRGCPLGVPLVQSIYPQGAYNTGGMSGLVYLAVQPIMMPPGEDRLRVEFGMDEEGGARLTAVFYDEDMAEVTSATMEYRSGLRCHRADVGNLTPSTFYILIVEARLTDFAYTSLTGLRVFFDRLAPAGAALYGLVSPDGASYSLSVTTAGGATIPSLPGLDAALLADSHAMHAYLISEVNAAQATLEEYVTGAPASGNDALTLADSGANAPTTSAFKDHSRRGDWKDNEPAVFFPVWGESFGAVSVGAFAGEGTNYKAPALLVEDTKVPFHTVPVWIPHGPSPSVLTGYVIVSDTNASKPDATVYIETLNKAGSSSVGEASAAVSWITGTNLGLATIDAIPYTRDAEQLLRILVEADPLPKGGGADFFILGALVVCEP